MANLKKQRSAITEYTDVKDVRHKVEHIIVPAEDKNSKELIIEEILQALTRPNKRKTA